MWHGGLKVSQVNTYSDFHDISILADLEQGYGDVKYTRYGVTKAIQNGISMLHIEVCSTNFKNFFTTSGPGGAFQASF